MMRSAACVAILATFAAPAHAQEVSPTRPAPLPVRWLEDWSVLADPRVSHEPLDALKYIELSPSAPKAWLTLSFDQRLRLESFDAQSLAAHSSDDTYLLSRTEVSADLHLGRFQAYGQLNASFAPGKRRPTPTDVDRLDLEQGFISYAAPLGSGTLTLRAGRQEFAFDRRRFISSRIGPNVRQPFDALWVQYAVGPWRLIGFATQPVVARDARAFDDASSDRLTTSGVRVERRLVSGVELSGYWVHYTRSNATFDGVTGNERRDAFDLRLAGQRSRWDWDVEAMIQTGRFADRPVAAWAAGAVIDYRLTSSPLAPKLGIELDLASGDDGNRMNALHGFNPLFPNGQYFTLAGYTGYANLVHLKSSVTFFPAKKISVTLAAAAQWRATTHDAIYLQPAAAVPGSADFGSRWTGSYGQLRADWRLSPHFAFAIEAVHYEAGATLRALGRRSSSFLAIEADYAL